MNVAHAEISYDDHTLPSDTLFHVLSLLSFSERRLTISLVCKKWKELTMQHCSPLWRSCNIYVHREAPGFPTLKYHKVVRWLSKHGQAVQPLEITIKDTDEPQQCTHLLHVALSELSAATVVDWWGLCQSLVNLLRHREARVRMLVAIGSVPIHPLWVTD
ncbi:hypothetical protein WJX84_000869 [Apatococcus fuscideae]|uniref:F-box domain-containing protein n=1 Tax=Apatococcus fuscideae TaxID=2026836 RepID=A0AAW1SS44_9CHLO